ncbi:alpha/beta fold hydrolase [Kibdelosporangium aridum]|uniref:alpha/beta fold hydrolase n=1 Tax=Kibdelosporangium aridum TaxID=2030 RepID=UPI00068C2586
MIPVWTNTRLGAVHALTEGGPARGDVVIMPGLGVSVYLRSSVSSLAAAGFRAWLPDPPGFGDSEDPPRSLGITDIAAVAVQWLRLRDLGSVTLIGHSCGTQVAAHVAASAPELVQRLVLGSPTVDPRYRTWPKALGRWLRDGRREPSSLTKTQRPEWRRAGPGRLLRLAHSMLADDIETTLRRVTCPVSVIRGDRDPISTAEWARGLGHYVELPGLAHAFPYEAPSSFAEVLLESEQS